MRLVTATIYTSHEMADPIYAEKGDREAGLRCATSIRAAEHGCD